MNIKDQGLSSAAAAQRLRADGPNELPRNGSRGSFTVMIDVVTEPMFLLLLAAAGVYMILGDLRESLVLCSSTLIIIAITFIQERRTENTLAKLRDLTTPQAVVIRDKQTQTISSKDVVVDDIIMLSEGDRVPADAQLLQSTSLSSDESILTGESLPVDKLALNDGRDHVYRGTLIVSGYATAKVFATGARTRIGLIGKDLQSIPSEVTPLYREVRWIVRRIAIAALLLCIAVAVVYAITHHQWLGGILAGITVAMGMLPEEFPVVLTVFLAMGAWRISRHHVLTRRMPAIESLGAATILAVDKTGTLTENRMKVACLVTLEHSVQNIFDLRNGIALDDAAKQVLAVARAASEIAAFDPMEIAIHQASTLCASAESQVYESSSLVREYDLTPQLLAVTHFWQRPQTGKIDVTCKGAPETLMRLCKLDNATTEALNVTINRLSTQGLRVLGVARGSADENAIPASPEQCDLTFIGLICLADPVRQDVPAAVAECRSAGIRVVMITGDHAGTARTIAEQANLDSASQVITCDTLNSLTDEELQQRIRAINVFARATPQHKLRLVQALKNNKEVVVMTGDGVNDAPALKAAHVGVAMGKRGTDVAREAASLILLNDDFASLVAGVRLGRRIYNNIQHAMCYLVAVHIPLAGLALIPILLGLPLVFYPVHVLFLEFLIDPACSFVFEAESEAKDIMQRKPRAVDSKLFSFASMRDSVILGCASSIAALGTYYVALRWLPETQSRALCFSALVVGNIALMLMNRTHHSSFRTMIAERNHAFWAISTLAALGLICVVHIKPLADVFQFSSPSLLATILMLLTTIGMIVITKVALQSMHRS